LSEEIPPADPSTVTDEKALETPKPLTGDETTTGTTNTDAKTDATKTA